MSIDDLYRQLIRPGCIFFDVGANIGFTAQVVAPLVGAQGQCHSFECHPIHYTQLAFQAAHWPQQNIFPYCVALSSGIGHAILYTGSEPAAAQSSTINQDLGTPARLGKEIARIKVETDSLDNFCTRKGLTPDFLKIDVEGAEQEVFAGALNMIAKKLPKLIFEFGTGFDKGYIPKYFTRLEELGYDFFLIDILQFLPHTGYFGWPERILFHIAGEDIVKHKISGNILALQKTESKRLLTDIQQRPLKDLEQIIAKK